MCTVIQTAIHRTDRFKSVLACTCYHNYKRHIDWLDKSKASSEAYLLPQLKKNQVFPRNLFLFSIFALGLLSPKAWGKASISVFVPAPYYSDNYSFFFFFPIVWSQGAWFLQLHFFFLKIALAIQGVLYFHRNCIIFYYQFSSVAQSCPTLCDPMNHSTPGLPVHHQLPEFIQTHVHRLGDAIQTSHPLSSPSPPAPNPSQHQSLLQWVNSSHKVAKVLEFQLQHQSFQWIPRADLI